MVFLILILLQLWNVYARLQLGFTHFFELKLFVNNPTQQTTGKWCGMSNKIDNQAENLRKEKVVIIKDKAARTPEQELEFLCDFSVKACVAHVSEFSPGTEYFDAEDAETLLKFLQQTPDLTGVLLDGLTSVHRPGILSDSVVFYNKLEEDLLKHLEENLSSNDGKTIEWHEHVHWMFNELMKIQEEWLRKFRAALPKVKIVYSIDSDDFHSMTERMLRVLVQSGEAKLKVFTKSLEDRLKEFHQKLDGFGNLNQPDLQARLRDLESKRRKQTDDRAHHKRTSKTDRKIAAIKAELELLAKRDELEIKRKVFQERKDNKRLRETEKELVKVKDDIGKKELGLKKLLITLNAEYQTLANKASRRSKRLSAKIAACKEDVAEITGQIDHFTDKLNKLAKMFRPYREPETSGVYQLEAEKHVNRMYRRFYKMGDKYDIDIATKPGPMVFGSLVIDYAHDRGRTWAPMPGRVKRLAEAFHGLIDNHRENIAAMLKELKKPVSHLDVVLESGHHGVFFARWQRDHLTDEEIRMQHVNTFDTGGSDGVDFTVYIAGMPFEPQDKIEKYLARRKPARTRGGKPIASASHPLFIRNSKRSVSGLTLIRKHQHGFISVEAIAYQLFRNKQVLEPFKAIMSQSDSDNHLNSPEVDLPGTVGTLAMNKQLLKKPFELCGQKVHLGGTLNLGDTAEANSTVWSEAYKHRRAVIQSLKEINGALMTTDTSDYNSVHELMTLIANHLVGGANENMKLNQEEVLWYFKEKFLAVYHDSPARLRDILATLEGNHFANASRKSGSREFDLFVTWLRSLETLHRDFPSAGYKPFSLKILAGGEPEFAGSTVSESEMVVHLGGYSSGRQWIIPQYGVGHDGKLLVQKTYRLGMTHEPNAALNKARNQQADVMMSGHTHESYLLADKIGSNTVRFIDQKPCTQRPTATELYYGGLPRTAGVDLNVLFQPGRYFKLTIPMEHMRRIGRAQMLIDQKAAVENKKK